MNCSTTRQRIRSWLVLGLPPAQHVPKPKQEHDADRGKRERNGEVPQYFHGWPPSGLVAI